MCRSVFVYVRVGGMSPLKKARVGWYGITAKKFKDRLAARSRKGLGAKSKTSFCLLRIFHQRDVTWNLKLREVTKPHSQ